MTGYRFVSEHRGEYPVLRLCSLAGISRSGFYDWVGRGPCDREVANEVLLVAIREIYDQSRCTYGSPRVHGQLQRRGMSVGLNRVAKIMAENQLVGVHATRRWKRGRPGVAPAPDLVNRQFTAASRDELWLADITQFNTGEGKFFVAGVLDIATKRLVGWSMHPRQTSNLVVDAMVMAAATRTNNVGGVHHSDRGSQYTSMVFTDRLHELGIAASFGSTGDCYDNAPMEAFWATMKRELRWIYGSDRFSTRAELRAVVFDYVEVFYNRQRHQQGLGHMTPAEYTQQITAA